MHYTHQQQEAAADANTELLVRIQAAAHLRHIDPTLSYYESVAQVHEMPLEKRITLIIAAVVREDAPDDTR